MNKTPYWPGTGIRKSYGNDFDLSACKGALAAMAIQTEQKAQAGLKGAVAQQSNRAPVPTTKHDQS